MQIGVGQAGRSRERVIEIDHRANDVGDPLVFVILKIWGIAKT